MISGLLPTEGHAKPRSPLTDTVVVTNCENLSVKYGLASRSSLGSLDLTVNSSHTSAPFRARTVSVTFSNVAVFSLIIQYPLANGSKEVTDLDFVTCYRGSSKGHNL